MKGFVDDIEELTESNKDFRRVLYTGKHLQLVLMSLKGQDTLRYMEDTAQALLNPSVYANGVLAAPSVEQEAARQEVVQ